MSKVVTRIAPSPTGNLHIGTARSTLFNYLFARQQGGEFIVRIEDTDQARSAKEYETDILDSLQWLGLVHDTLYRQSERTHFYTAALEQLIEKDSAYISKERAKEDAGREVEVVRLRNPGIKLPFNDLVRGEVTFDTTELGDFIIARSLVEPLYHLAVVVDDASMGITHVIRGEDHISNTPRQILLQRALGYETPQYAHIPIILAADRSKLSKRKGATAIAEFRAQGYLPEALTNYLALLGWNPGTERELFSIEELVQAFAIEQIHKGGAMFDEEKLRWFNRHYIDQMTPPEFLDYITPYVPKRIKELQDYSEEALRRLLPTIRERISVGSDIETLAESGELDYFFSTPKLKAEMLTSKGGTQKEAEEHLEAVVQLLEKTGDFSAAGVKDAVWHYAEEKGKGAVLWPMRVALSGKERSTDPFSIAAIIGRKETLKRLHHAHSLLTVSRI